MQKRKIFKGSLQRTLLNFRGKNAYYINFCTTATHIKIGQSDFIQSKLVSYIHTKDVTA